MLTPACTYWNHRCGADRAAWDVPGSLAGAGEGRQGAHSRSCLYLHNYSQPPRLLVSAGSSLSCLLSWQLVVGLEEEMAVSSLWGGGVS